MAKNMYFKYGAMNSGKTTRLIQEAFNFEEQGGVVVVGKPSIDTKGGEMITSRLGVERAIDFSLSPEDSVMEKLEPVLARTALDCVLIDEGQFLTPEQVDQLYMELTMVRDIPVMAYGIPFDFRGKLFPGSRELFARSDKQEEIPTICQCMRKARFNARLRNGEPEFEGPQVAIDGVDGVTYKTMCKDCFREAYLSHLAAKEALVLDVAGPL